MNEGRILQLQQFLKEDENDHFSRYALAMEHKEEKPYQAIEYLEKLRQINQNYIALYYHLAELYCETDQIELAREVFLTGISLLEQSDDKHALKELKNAYQNFLFEND